MKERGKTRDRIALRIALPAFLTIVLFVAVIFLVVIPTFEQSIVAQKRQMAHELTEVAWSYLASLYEQEQAGGVSREGAQARAVLRIRNLRYGPEGKDYFWINDMHPRMVMHPYRSDLEGQDLTNFADPEGNHLFVDFVKMVEENGAGYVGYFWQWKDDPAIITPKISYVKGFEPWGWIIGTGIYMEDVQREVSVLKRDLVQISAAILAVVGLLVLYIIRQTIKADRRRDQLWDRMVKSEENYRELVENANSLIVKTDPFGRVDFFNEFAQDFFGYKSEEITGESLFPTIIPDENLKERFLETHEKKEGVESECRRRDGMKAWVFWTNRALTADDGTLQGYLCVGTDYTERRKNEEERNRLVKDLAAKNKEMESVIYVTSHDLRSPLVNIQGFSRELGLNCGALEEKITRLNLSPKDREEFRKILEKDVPLSLKYIEGSAAKMDQLLKGLLELSRLGRIELIFSELDMNAMVQEIIEGLQYLIQQKNVSVSIEGLPSCRGDAGQINQVFTNLLDNALKYLSPDRRGEIKIKGEKGKNAVIYCVEDNGMGIEKDHQKKIFEIFHRLDPRGAVAGEGLGLTIVQRIVSRHGGRVWVESAPRKGSRFYIEIPTKGS